MACVYATGYLILALHHSQYGIAEFSLLKARIFSAGAWFVVLLAIPVMAASRVYSLFGLGKASGISISADAPTNRVYVALDVGLAFYVPCVGLAWFLSTALFDLRESQGIQNSGFYYACSAFALVALVVAGKSFRKAPAKSVVLMFLGSANEFTALLLSKNWALLWLSLWLYFTGVTFVFFYHAVQDPGERKKMEWETYLPIVLIALVFFSQEIYGRIRPGLGGGEPIPVRFQFTGKTPLFNSDSARVLLVDETDYGYYVVRPEGGDKAVFVRRDQVSGIEFGVGIESSDQSPTSATREKQAKPQGAPAKAGSRQKPRIR